MNISKILSLTGILVGSSFALLAGGAHAEVADNYAGISIQTDDSAFGVFGKAEVVELGDTFLDSVSIRPNISFDDNVALNVAVTTEKEVTRNLDIYAGPSIGFDSTGDDDINLGLALGADYQIGRSDFVANGNVIVGTNDSSLRIGIGYGF